MLYYDHVQKEAIMGYKVLGDRETKWQPRKGLEGPFFYPNGQVLYYDAKAGQYYDPTSDFYVSNEDVAILQQDLMDLLAR